MNRWWLAVAVVLTALYVLSSSQQDGTPTPLEWIPMSDSAITLPPGDDTATQITSSLGFAFGGALRHDIYVSTNGLISFDTAVTNFFNVPFPSFLTNFYVIAPFWDDINTNNGGTISYDVNEDPSSSTMQTVSTYVSAQIGAEFAGYWMLVVYWNEVPPFSFFTTTNNVNTFQAILIMDANQNSYGIFIYECGLLQWDNGATIGYNAGPEHFDNHDPSSSVIACVSYPANNFSNVFYTLHEAEPLPSVEPQNSYLDFFGHTTTTISSGFLQSCDDCISPEISLPGDFPFGNYYHQSAYVASNGHISFHTAYTHFNSELFPTTNPNIYWDFVVAPFWSDVDLRLEGSASWEIHTTQQSQGLIDSVSTFIQTNYEGASAFSGSWMMITYWEDVHPFPHGFGIETPYTLSTNTFQAVLITNGTKSYVVYTYSCGEMEWGDESTVGFNAGEDYFENHPITGHFQSHFISCLQNMSNNNTITNVIYDLVPDVDSLLPGAIPPFHDTIGSCAIAGFTECCEENDCRGLPLHGSCYCDGLCSDRGDCCYDQQFICPTGLLTDDYVILAVDTEVLHMSLNGTDLQTLVSDVNERAYGIDYHLTRQLMVWSDVENDVIYMKSLDGTGLVTQLVTTNIAAVDDLAIDWIGNNLYWTDAQWSRIEVMNLDTRDRAEVLRTEANFDPRAIAVDPTTKYMYWTELGISARIKRAYMDGTSALLLIGFLVQPNGLTVDIEEQRLYWCDTAAGTVVYAELGSSGLQNIIQLELADGTIGQPFSIAVSATSVFWTDWSSNSLVTTHKDHGNGDDGHLFTVYTASLGSPRGVEVVASSQQPTAGITNPCNTSGCSHICMLSGNTAGFTCTCPENYVLDGEGITCQMVSTPSPTAPPEGSCGDAGYVTCCSHGACGGNPATCFCDVGCYERFDCCSDMYDICNEVPPIQVAFLNVETSTTTATVTFTIDVLVHGTETYRIAYGTTPAQLDQMSDFLTVESAGDFSILIENLLPGTTYYFQLSGTNAIDTSLSGIISNATLEDAPSGPPQNLVISVAGTTLTASWEPPLPAQSSGVISSYTLLCFSGETLDLRLNPISTIQLYDLSPNTQYMCRIAAWTAVGQGPFSSAITVTTEGSDINFTVLRWIPMGANYDSSQQQFLPATDDGFEGPIAISIGFPFGSSVQQEVFVGTNGLISFETGYNSFSNQPFPGNAAIQSRYLVAPFWDDVDIRFDTGEISYEIHEFGYFLNQVNNFIQTSRPTDFEGTWMMVVFYDAVHPFFGLINPQENTFQVILITDGTYSYTVFIYQCGLMGWDNGATIGFNAASETFANHNPSTSAVACLNEQDSDWSNVLYRLSNVTDELPPPTNVEAQDITLNSTTILWVVTEIEEQQQYTVQYGTVQTNLELSLGPIFSIGSVKTYQATLGNLTQGTTYYVRVQSEFASYTLSSDVISFTTLEPAIEVAPSDFVATAIGTSVTFSWSAPVVSQVIVSFNLVCHPNSEINIEVKNINTITLYDLPPGRNLSCTLAAASSGGYGPPTPAIYVVTEDAVEADSYLSFIPMDIHVNFEQLFFPGTDEGYFGPIVIPGGFPFGDTIQTEVYIGSNGILSFGSPYNTFLNQELPVADQVLVAPFWDDIDTRFGSGQISFEIQNSGYFLEEVSEFIRRRRSALSFDGAWMLIVYWDAVHPYFGIFNDEENTFQAIIITDGTYSYSLFTYKCDLMEWDNGVTIGYSDGADFFLNNIPSTSEVACLNLPVSNFSNVIYRLSSADPEIPPPDNVDVTNITMTQATISWNIPFFTVPEEYTVEYGLSLSGLTLESNTVQSITDDTITNQPYAVTLRGLTGATKYYFRVVARFDVYVRHTQVSAFFTQFEPQNEFLEFLAHTNTSINSGILLSCEHCGSVEIPFPSDFPFGGYYHQSAYVGTDGYITFGQPLIDEEPEPFPPANTDVFWTYMIAPFWANFDTTMGGLVSWELHTRTNSFSLVTMVDSFIADEYGDENFEGSWMLIAFWENVQPSDLTNGNTFQAVLTTNGTKSYGVMIYHCGDLGWSDSATIGYNAPVTATYTHPLSLVETGINIKTDEIACIHSGSEWSNLIFELEVSNHILEMTPEPHFSTGSCVDAGFTECCTGFACSVDGCFCDSACHFFRDCCFDIDETCPASEELSYDILVGHGHHISQIHFEGTSSETVRTNTSGTVVGVDYLSSDSLMFWSDVTTDTIHRANLDGTGEVVLVDSCISSVDDIAVDWVTNKLYWTDSIWARIEALDLSTNVRVEVLKAGTNSAPRAIAVDPINRVMFWTDYGVLAKIETAGMDGGERRTLHFSEISQPNGIAIDYNSDRIYWSDSSLDRLEYSKFDGSERTVVEAETTGLVHPFSVTVVDNLLFWSDWATQKIYATHKEHGTLQNEGYFSEIVTFLDTPYGIEALRSDRQPPALENPCLNSGCSHMCLLTFVNEAGFTCACPEGYEFENETFCKPEEGPSSPCATTPGSCAAYESCCEEGFCAGSPATCFCDADCRLREDCCSDINDTCIEGFPRLPRDITVTENTGQSVTITWLIPYIASSPETYSIQYGTSADNLDRQAFASGSNTTAVNQQYSRTLLELTYTTTYYFRMNVRNDVGNVSTEILSFTTAEGAPSAPPTDFSVSVVSTSVCLMWSPPLQDQHNGVLISYTLTCSGSSGSYTQTVKPHIKSFCFDGRVGNQDLSCSVAASTGAGTGPSTATITVTTGATDSGTLEMLVLNGTFGVDSEILPESDEGTFGPINLPTYGFPFWSSNREEVYIAINGLLAFDQPYGSFFNQPFPGSFFISSRYLLAPFWDDANTNGGGGQISYEVHTSGYLLDHISAFVRAQRPSPFQGTWMLVVFYDAVHPFFGSGENTYQLILVTDGSYTYTIFIYDCNLMEWGTSATIGFNAGGEMFENNEYTTNAIACSSLPHSNITNVIYRLSESDEEYVLPTNIAVVDIERTSVTVQWVVPSVTQQQQYTVLYGLNPQSLDQISPAVVGNSDITLTNQQYSVAISGLQIGTTYYFRISTTFGEVTFTTETNEFRTLDEPPADPPQDISITVTGVAVNLTWNPPPNTPALLSYTLFCSINTIEVVSAVLKATQAFTLEELRPGTLYSCSLLASTSGGDGPNALFSFNTEDIPASIFTLPFITMNSLLGVEETIFPGADEATNGPFELNNGFPFGSSTQTQAWVSTNGLLSFGTAYNSFFNQPFPGSSTISSRYLVAPYWADIDTNYGGEISYEVHETGYYLDRVNLFLKRNRPSEFQGSWMIVFYWNAVRPYFGLFNPQENTFQATLVSDGVYSYAIFTYKCGLMEWNRSPTIGYNAAGEKFANNDPSSSAVACLNTPTSDYSNVIYLLSNDSPEIPRPQDVAVTSTTSMATVSWRIPSFVTQEQYYVAYGTDRNNLNQTSSTQNSPTDTSLTDQTYSTIINGLEPGLVYYIQVTAVYNEEFVRYTESSFITKEPEQTAYLQFLLPTNPTTLESCDDCSSEEILFPSDFPFGGYFHQSAYVSTNGLISFGREVSNSNPVLFPSTTAIVAQSYILAPFWADFDTTEGGSVSWWIEQAESSVSIGYASNFIQNEYGDGDFSATWMLAAHWEDLQPGNEFQAVLLTDGVKSYAVFTYMCGALEWSDAATIGLNTPADIRFNHPLSGTDFIDEIACIHIDSQWKNLIYDLEISSVILPQTPAPANFLGSCIAAGYTDCCTDFSTGCRGAPVADCYCDSFCIFFGDCCYDFTQVCHDVGSFDILVGHGHHISQIHFEGDVTETLRTNTSGTVVGVDYSDSLSMIYWSDITTDTIHRANMDGTQEEILVNTDLIAVDDIAVDWVSEKLYWTDAGWARIEVMDLQNFIRIELVRTGTNTAPRGIAVDPTRRVMYWTDWGREAKIEMASMDGSERRDFVIGDLSQPNGISIDLVSERVYWSDSDLDKLEFIGFDGTGRTQVETQATGLQHPFSVSVGGDVLFWSDWDTNSIYVTHKEHGANDGQGYFNSIATLPSTPYGVEALLAQRQPSAENPCEVNNCSHVCLLSEVSQQGFTCACPLGYELDTPTVCKVTGDHPSPTPPPDGTCAAASYEYCCEHGFCAGYPATCFCDSDCYQREDCCSDISDTCTEGSPRAPIEVSVSDITAISALIRWTIPFIVSTQETYYVLYGLDQHSLTLQSALQMSGPNISRVYFQLLSNLDAAETYYYRVIASNNVGETGSDLESFMTPSGPPTGSPLNFTVEVAATSMAFSWSPPERMLQNGAIVSYTLECIGNTDTVSVTTSQQQFIIDTFIPGASFLCSVYATNSLGDGPPTDNLNVMTESVPAGTAAYLPLLSLGNTQVTLPGSDEGLSSAIPLPEIGFPFWSTSRSSVYVATNGVLSFDIPYGHWINSPFPGFVGGRYLVVPFWDDADTRFGNGQVSYAVYDTGYALEYVSAFIRRRNPSDFQGTWMMVSFWDSVRPYHSFFSSQENTYQAILITNGFASYTIFTYDCNMFEWGFGATIGYNAGGEAFENNVYTDNSIACSSLPDSNITNVVYRLSSSNPEYPPPQDVQLSDIGLSSVTVSWLVPYASELQQYIVVFGVQPDVLDQSWGLLYSSEDPSPTNKTFSIAVQGLTQGTDYYIRISSTFGHNVIYSDLVSFTTLDPPPTGPPLNFFIDITGTTLDLSWEQPAVAQRSGVIRYYNLTCSPQGGEQTILPLNNVTIFSLDDFKVDTRYTCTISALTSGGPGPTTSVTATTDSDVGDDIYLPLVRAGSLFNVESTEFEEVDDGTSDAINTPPFPFGNFIQYTVFVGSNGILSFGSQFNSFFNSPFSETTSEYIVGPFWDDVNIVGGNGKIFYEVHNSGYFLDQVNSFLQKRRPSTSPFMGTWMLAAYWDAVHPFSFTQRDRENTFEAILITDGTYSYTIFTYQCGLMEWDTTASIGFKGSGDFFADHDPSTAEVACLNYPKSNYSNIIYLLSSTSLEIPLPDMVTTSPTTDSVSVFWRIPSFTTQEQYYFQYGTDRRNLDQQSDSIISGADTTLINQMYSQTLSGLEPGTVYYLRVVAIFDMFSKRQSEIVVFRTKENEQAYYLEYLDISDGAGVIEPCSDGCSSPEIILPYDLPFGGYFHKTAYVSTNGIITLGVAIGDESPQMFPASFWTYAVAPFWQNFNTTMGGRVVWKIIDSSNDSASVDAVNTLIKEEQGDTNFNGIWMLAASWEDTIVEGNSGNNSFQAVLISNGTKSYAIFTYFCGDIQWSGPFEIGYYAPPTMFYNHPLSFGPVEMSVLSCAHVESNWNNVILDTQPGNVILPSTPQSPLSSGSCRDAGYDECCESGNCFGTPIGDFPCYCDFICAFFGDCCFDAQHTCHAPTFDLLVGNGNHLSKIHFEGTASETVQTVSSGNVVGVDFHASRSLIFWSDTLMHTIHQADMNGDNDTVLVDSNIRAVDDIAVDWIANNLYWVDSVWVRIEALNLDSLERSEIVRTGANTRPRAIAVDPIDRIMFWTDWGMTAKVERAFMDGEDRSTIHAVGLSQPNGITIDYSTKKIYWSDAELDKIEYSNYDGSERTLLESLDDGILHPFGLSIADELLFWTDWETNYLYYTHKDHGNTEGLGVFQPLAHFTSTPYGVEALVDSRQTPGENPCEGHECAHVCVLSGTSSTGYVCACAAGSDLQNDDKSCSPTPEPEDGSCINAEYVTCCSHGYCAGSPATCSCNPDCHDLGDCCGDIASVCPAVLPNLPSVQVVDLTHIGALIEWTVPAIVFSAETYTLLFSTTPDDLNTVMGGQLFSGTDVSVTDKLYSVKLDNLSPGTTYYYQLAIQNTVGTKLTDVLTFDTPIVGPPQNFQINVTGTETLTFSWELPLSIGLDEIQYFVIDCEPKFQHDLTQVVADSFTATLEEFLPGTTYTCTVAAKTNELGAPAVQTATTEEAPSVLPFLVLGTTEGVEKVTLPSSDDANSAPIYIPGGLPLGAVTHTIAHVGTNGIVSLGQPFQFHEPQPFPTNNFFIHSSYVVAPFWSDVDTRSAGSVSYETHQRGFNAKSNAMLERVSGFIAARENISFTASWMLLAHWDRVHPYPHGSSDSEGPYQDFLNSENTYQTILITDGMLNFVMYTYQCGLMGWSGYTSYATIGYNLNGEYQNHPLSGISEVNTIACFSNNEDIGRRRRQASSSWHNELYQLPSAISPIQQLQAECRTMEILDIQTNGDIMPLARSLGACPPTFNQAFVDFRFTYNSSISSESLCFVQVFAAGSFDISSLICCYALMSSGAAGSLVVGGKHGSSISFYHPAHFYEDYEAFDKDFRDKCCTSGLCDVFHSRRPLDNSLNYIPPFFAWGNGDPHITTLDETTYTFNGRGEYTLVESLNTGFVLQGRTEPVSETSNATQFSAFAMGIRSQDLSAEVRISRGRLVSFINGEDVSSNIEFVNDTTIGGSNAFYLTRVGEDSIRLLFYRDRLAYVFTVTQRDDILDFILNLDPSLRGETRGLFGNFNGDDTDDFIKPNGVTVPSDASDQMLHEYGKSWQIIETESLFTYPSGMSSSNFTFPDHTPPFLSEVVANAPENIVNDCAGNAQCIFDVVETGNPDIGTDTLDAINSNNEDVMIANNFPPTLNGPNTFRVTVGLLSVYTFTATDTNSDEVVVSVQGAPADDYTLTPNGNSYTVGFSVEETFTYGVTITAADPMGATSTLTLVVEICACQNGGTCTLDGILQTDSNVIDMLCQCLPGWDGRYCESDQDGCSELICFQGVQCYDVAAPASGAVCESCPSGYEGDGEKCTDVDECDGSSICQQVCINTPGSFTCGCQEGYELSSTTDCIDIDECQLQLDGCQQGCTNTAGSYTCSCQAGFELNADGFTCNVLQPCEANSIPCANGQCAVVNGAGTCVCNNGYSLDNGGQGCSDIDECQNNVCEVNCKNTIGSFECSCKDGYSLSSDQRKCEDTNECLQIDDPPCDEKYVCQNTEGGVECMCPAGTMRSNGECVEVKITKPPVVVIPPTKPPPVDDKLGRENSVNVTLRITKEEFDMVAKFKFKIGVADEVTKYCAKNPSDCGGDMLKITFNDVIILDEIETDGKGQATFLMFVYTKNPTDVLSGKLLQSILESMTGIGSVSPVTKESEGGSGGGLSGGEIAAIVIVILVVVILVLIATVIILLKVKVVPKPPMPAMMSNLSMDIFRSRGRRSSMLIEEGHDGESMKDTVSVSGDVAEAKAKEAAAEQEEGEKGEEKEEVKVDLSKEAEEAV